MTVSNNDPRVRRNDRNEPSSSPQEKSDTEVSAVFGTPKTSVGTITPHTDDPVQAFKALNINDTTASHGGAQGPRLFKGGPNRYDNNRYDNKNNNCYDTNRYDDGQENGHYVRKFPAGTPKYPRGDTSHRNSNTWVSPENLRMQEFLVIRNAMRRIFKHSDVAKWKFPEYIAHVEAMTEHGKQRLAAQLKEKEDKKSLLSSVPQADAGSLGCIRHYLPGYTTDGTRSLVLGEKTIWCNGWQVEKDEIAPWPSQAELKWEGDDRAKTGVGRFPPLPREMGAPGIPWNQLQAIEQYPLDQVGRIPTMEDVYLPVDEIDDDVKYNLINKELEEAMDKYLES